MARKTSRKRIGRPRNSDRPKGAPPTRRRILNAAGDLFAEKGFQSASMKEVAERADLTIGAIYRYFPSKADLMLWVTMEEMKAHPFQPGDPCEALVDSVVRFSTPQLRKFARIAIESHTAATRSKRAAFLLSDINDSVIRSMRAALEQARERGEASSTLDVDRAAHLVLVLMMGMAHLDTLDSSLIGDEAWQEFLADAIRRMLGMQEARQVGSRALETTPEPRRRAQSAGGQKK